VSSVFTCSHRVHMSVAAMLRPLKLDLKQVSGQHGVLPAMHLLVGWAGIYGVKPRTQARVVGVAPQHEPPRPWHVGRKALLRGRHGHATTA
jgi:hypothetical protein